MCVMDKKEETNITHALHVSQESLDPQMFH